MKTTTTIIVIVLTAFAANANNGTITSTTTACPKAATCPKATCPPCQKLPTCTTPACPKPTCPKCPGILTHITDFSTLDPNTHPENYNPNDPHGMLDAVIHELEKEDHMTIDSDVSFFNLTGEPKKVLLYCYYNVGEDWDPIPGVVPTWYVDGKANDSRYITKETSHDSEHPIIYIEAAITKTTVFQCGVTLPDKRSLISRNHTIYGVHLHNISVEIERIVDRSEPDHRCGDMVVFDVTCTVHWTRVYGENELKLLHFTIISHGIEATMWHQSQAVNATSGYMVQHSSGIIVANDGKDVACKLSSSMLHYSDVEAVHEFDFPECRWSRRVHAGWDAFTRCCTAAMFILMGWMVWKAARPYIRSRSSHIFHRVLYHDREDPMPSSVQVSTADLTGVN